MSAAMWSESEPEEAHPGLGRRTIQQEDLAGRQPQEGAAPYFVLPTDLEPGDRLRDHGRLRTIIRVEHRTVPAPGIVLAVFDDDGDSLGIPPHQHVSVWRKAPNA